jgi:hypothetical protein
MNCENYNSIVLFIKKEYRKIGVIWHALHCIRKVPTELERANLISEMRIFDTTRKLAKNNSRAGKFALDRHLRDQKLIRQ